MRHVHTPENPIRQGAISRRTTSIRRVFAQIRGGSYGRREKSHSNPHSHSYRRRSRRQPGEEGLTGRGRSGVRRGRVRAVRLRAGGTGAEADGSRGPHGVVGDRDASEVRRGSPGEGHLVGGEAEARSLPGCPPDEAVERRAVAVVTEVVPVRIRVRIADVTHAVVIGVRLVRVGDEWTIVPRVGHSIAIRILVARLLGRQDTVGRELGLLLGQAFLRRLGRRVADRVRRAPGHANARWKLLVGRKVVSSDRCSSNQPLVGAAGTDPRQEEFGGGMIESCERLSSLRP